MFYIHTQSFPPPELCDENCTNYIIENKIIMFYIHTQSHPPPPSNCEMQGDEYRKSVTK
jgi:hypothetical protein